MLTIIFNFAYFLGVQHKDPLPRINNTKSIFYKPSNYKRFILISSMSNILNSILIMKIAFFFLKIIIVDVNVNIFDDEDDHSIEIT